MFNTHECSEIIIRKWVEQNFKQIHLIFCLGMNAYGKALLLSLEIPWSSYFQNKQKFLRSFVYGWILTRRNCCYIPWSVTFKINKQNFIENVHGENEEMNFLIENVDRENE